MGNGYGYTIMSIDETHRVQLRSAMQGLMPYFSSEQAIADVESNATTMEDVRAFLHLQISTLLDRNPQRLMSILYRIDVAESLVQQAIKTAPAGKLADTLVELIIARQLQKIETRKKYSGSGQ